MFDPELEDFKIKIDLRAYAAAQGYQIDNRESWRGSSVMRHPRGDKIVIKRDTDDHYVFFSVHREASGSIIDFVQYSDNLSLGTVRKELRPWLGTPPVPVPLFRALTKTAKDRMRVETEYAKMEDALRHPYLENERAIPAALLGLERFGGRVRMDSRGNAVFPHVDAEGICGFEIKNSNGFTGFAAGGTKGLWLSQERPDDNSLVVSESAIDSLSYAGRRLSGCLRALKSCRQWMLITKAQNWLRWSARLSSCQAVMMRASLFMSLSGLRTGTISSGRNRNHLFPTARRSLPSSDALSRVA